MDFPGEASSMASWIDSPLRLRTRYTRPSTEETVSVSAIANKEYFMFRSDYSRDVI